MKLSVTGKLLLFAEDSALLKSEKSFVEIENQHTQQLNFVHEWFIDNKLSIHLGKTEAILFGPPTEVVLSHIFNISYLYT